METVHVNVSVVFLEFFKVGQNLRQNEMLQKPTMVLIATLKLDKNDKEKSIHPHQPNYSPKTVAKLSILFHQRVVNKNSLGWCE